MKNKSSFIVSFLAVFLSFWVTSCKSDEPSYPEVKVVNTTSNYCVNVLFDGAPVFSENWRIWAGEQEDFDLKIHGVDVKFPVDITINWHEMTGYRTFNKKIARTKTYQNYKFVQGKNYKITVRETDWTIQQQ